MCGIAGLLNRDGKPAGTRTVRRMADAMVHRGPDDWGVFSDGPAALGHRRLSIIDLSRAGRQPMSDDSGAFVISYNGEVYNFKELRTELENEGCIFRSATDTEVALLAYRQWGEDALLKFNGMFAFAIWDAARREFFLARDRFGVKPLYYAFAGKTFIFASEIKALLEHPALRAEVEPRALLEYFTFQNIYSDLTLFKGVRMLPPGCSMRVGLDGHNIKRYWDFLPAANEIKMSKREAAERVRACFEGAVRRQLVSDVPVGCYLSGGMDSGAITAVASGVINPLLTFTGGFDMSGVSGFEQFFDEREPARLMSRAFGTQHCETVMRAGDMVRVLPELVRSLEDPRIGMSWQNYYISRFASERVKVVLGGTGGDEMFAGYPWRYARGLAASNVTEFENELYSTANRFLPLEPGHDIIAHDVIDESKDWNPFDVFKALLEPVRGIAGRSRGGRLQAMLYFEAKTFLHGLFVVDDKLSMAHSLESRVPFLDNELVDLSLSLPADYKLDIGGLMKNGGATREWGGIVSGDGKVVLRRAMKGLIPDEILSRKKQGFTPPETSWYRGPGLKDIKETLFDPEALSRTYIQPGLIKKVITEHATGRANHRSLIWSLLCLEWWHRIFIDKQLVQ